MYRVKTAYGYFHMTHAAQYSCVNGKEVDAWVLCKKHASKEVDRLNGIFYELAAHTEEVDSAECRRCLTGAR